MYRRMTIFACVGVVVLLSSVCALNAAVYNLTGVGGDMYVAETSGPAGNTFGPWSLGNRTLAQGYASAAINLNPVHYTPDPNFGLNGWAVAGGLPGVFVNTNAAPTSNILPGEVATHPGGGGEMSVARWTAPSAGLATAALSFWQPGTAADQSSVDFHVVLNGVSLFDQLSYGNVYDATQGAPGGVWSYALPSTLVAPGDVLDFVAGYGGDASHAGDINALLNFSVTLGPVPEPSTLVLVFMGLLGLLAYAWRKR